MVAGHVPGHRESGRLPQQLRRSPLQVWLFLHDTRTCGGEWVARRIWGFLVPPQKPLQGIPAALVGAGTPLWAG